MRELVFVALATLAGIGGAQATVTPYTSHAAFAAHSTTTNLATFESFLEQSYFAPITDDGIKFTALPGGHAIHTLYVAGAGNLENAGAQFSSSSLTASGDENFLIQLADGATFTSIGFEVATNSFGAPTLFAYDSNNVLLGSAGVTAGTNSLGYIGLTSTSAIAYATFIVDRGWIEDTGIDNVAIGMGSVPEPASWALMVGGFAMVGSAYRRRAAKGAAVRFS